MAVAIIVLIIVLILLYLIGFRRMAIWLIIGASVNSSIFWLLGILLFIDYLVSERE